MSIPLACTRCKTILVPDAFATFTSESEFLCHGCQAVFLNHSGCLDMTVTKSCEREHYDGVYSPESESHTPSTSNAWAPLWSDPLHPERRKMLDILGNVEGKSMLLLGNGLSAKELHFASLGAEVIYSDLSIEAVKGARRLAGPPAHAGKSAFHAIDAFNLPLPDECLDVVYGWAFVHHLEDLDRFLAEVKRVLKPGGACYFYDNANSRAWQLAKFTVLFPLMKLSHWKWGISPEDRKATAKGGFTNAEVQEYQERHGFRGSIFLRFGLLYSLFNRGRLKLTGNSPLLEPASSVVVPALFHLDEYLARRSHLYENSTLGLIWGFRK